MEEFKLKKRATTKPKAKAKKSTPKPEARKTAEEHMNDYADNRGQQIGGRGYLVG